MSKKTFEYIILEECSSFVLYIRRVYFFLGFRYTPIENFRYLFYGYYGLKSNSKDHLIELLNDTTDIYTYYEKYTTRIKRKR